MNDRYLEDFAVGEKFSTGGITLSESMIVDFGLLYDAQSFHIDVEASRDSIYGGLIASGFQTLVLGFRMVLNTGVFRAGNLGSPGIDELRWTRPVRPGDTLYVDFEPVETRPSNSKPDRGTMRVAYRYRNQRDETVLTFTAIHLMRRRPPATIAT
jgi:acyl dehydratase